MKTQIERHSMSNESIAYPGVTEPPRPTISAHAGAQPDAQPTPPKPKRKRVKKTTSQKIAEAEQELKKLQAQLRKEQREARTHRLITSAATIEAEAGRVELDERIARWLGRVLANEIACKPEGEIAQYIARRDGKDSKQ